MYCTQLKIIINIWDTYIKNSIFGFLISYKILFELNLLTSSICMKVITIEKGMEKSMESSNAQKKYANSLVILQGYCQFFELLFGNVKLKSALYCCQQDQLNSAI